MPTNPEVDLSLPLQNLFSHTSGFTPRPLSEIYSHISAQLDSDPYEPPEETEPMTNHVRYVQRTYCGDNGTPDGYSNWQQYHDYVTARLTNPTLNPRYREDYEARLRECNDVIAGLAVWDRVNYRYTFSWMGPMDYLDATSYSSNGSSPEWFNTWSEYLAHLTRDPGHWSRYEDRIRECNDVLNETYIEFNARRHEYIWSWMIPEHVGIPNKSLLKVIKYIKKNRKTLKESSKCWSWLNTCKLRYFRKNRSRGGFVSNNQLADRFLEGVNKYINDPNFEIVYYQTPSGQNTCAFKHLLIVYHAVLDWHTFFTDNKGFGQTYITKAKAERFLTNNLAILVDGKYYSNSCLSLVYTHTNDDDPQHILIDLAKHAQCTSCKHIWTKNLITFSPKLDEKVCPVCTEKDNAEHDIDSVHGGYHSHRGEWKFFIRRKNDEQTLPMGIEIEMAARKAVHSMSKLSLDMYLAQKEFNKDWHEIYFERDGSIGDNGLECVSNPMTLDFAKDYWEKMLPIFRAKCIGWRTKAIRNTDVASYGIHLTCHRKYFTNLQLARTVKFFNSIDNHDFLKAIAQRDYLYGNESWCLKKNPSLVECNVLKDPGAARIQSSRGKYSPVNIKTINLVEFRMFASTLNHESFMKNYEFLDSFWHWIKDTGWSIDWKDYIQWLAVQKQTVRRWPNLVAYIYRDAFYVKNSRTTAYKVSNDILPVFAKLSVGKLILQEKKPTTFAVQEDTLTKDEDSCA